jgi:desulfoferrodoxin (superoxide reductase-like protein)
MRDVRNRVGRRDFVNALTTGAVLLVSGTAARAAAKDKDKVRPTSSKIHVCDVCGHVEFTMPPEFCPVCNAEERFKAKDSIFTDAMAKLKDGGAKHTPIFRVQQKPTLVSDVPCKEVLVRVGERMHEVDDANHIHFIDLYLDGGFFTRFFASPHMQPAVVLFVKSTATKIRAVAYCSKHGFWQAEASL